MRSLCQRVPVVTALAAQAVAMVAVMLVAPLVPELGRGWLIAHGLLAGGLAVALLGSNWWWPIQLVAPWLIAAGLASSLPSWVWLLALFLLFLVYGGGIATRVPLYLSNASAWAALTELSGPQVNAVDLGAGFGGPMRALARARPEGRFVSVEASPFTALVCWCLALSCRQVRVRWGSLWAEPLAGVELVYAFLSPAPMARLWEKACREMAPGSLLVSNTFPVPSIPPQRIVPLAGRDDAQLFVYRIPAASGALLA